MQSSTASTVKHIVHATHLGLDKSGVVSPPVQVHVSQGHGQVGQARGKVLHEGLQGRTMVGVWLP